MNDTGPRILSDDEVEQLTGYRRKHFQAKALEAMGISYFRRPDGRPVVSTSALSGETSRGAQPNFDALRSKS